MRRSIFNFSSLLILSTTTANKASAVSKYMLTTMFARPRAGILVSLRPLHTTTRIGYPRSPPASSCPLTKGGSSSSSSSDQQASAKKQKRHKWGERLGVLFAVGVVVYIADRELNASALSRSLRTGYIGVLCTLDYKLNFSPSKADDIESLHERVANRLRWVVDTNQGLYLKLGQAIGLQAGLLPKPYRAAFSHVFDNAPSVPYEEVCKVFKEDLGLLPTDMFEHFSPEALASASIAQVHKATLKTEHGNPDQVVAVKVQKPAISKQMGWDLFSYKTLMWLAQRAFDLPMYFVAEYVASQMKLETSFSHEAANARKCAELLARTPELKDDIYVPKVYGRQEGYPESDRILVMEWVDGCRLTDKKQLEAWGLNLREVMDLAIALNGAMTFSWGFIHCDPHPGNILVRPHPWKKGKPQLIVLDHGLYITEGEKFREDYATLWRSLFVQDVPTVEAIAKKWGIGLDPNMFASAVLLRPAQIQKVDRVEQTEKSAYELQVAAKAQLKALLESEQLIPRELIFIGRCQRMLQANNQTLGSPSSRVNITAQWAAKGYANGLTGSRSLSNVGLRPWLHDRWEMAKFQVTMWVIDLAFLWSKVVSWFRPQGPDWEGRLQKQMEQLAKNEFGLEIDDSAFLG